MTSTDCAVAAAPEAVAPICDWIDQFAQAVRDVDFDSARRMFADDVVGFGTVNEVLYGLDELEQKQWRKVWGATRGFDVKHDSIRAQIDGDTAWAVALWSSQGRNHKTWFHRHGRMTLVLEKRGGQWLAVHSHFSIVPESSL